MNLKYHGRSKISTPNQAVSEIRTCIHLHVVWMHMPTKTGRLEFSSPRYRVENGGNNGQNFEEFRSVAAHNPSITWVKFLCITIWSLTYLALFFKVNIKMAELITKLTCYCCIDRIECIVFILMNFSYIFLSCPTLYQKIILKYRGWYWGKEKHQNCCLEMLNTCNVILNLLSWGLIF